jgi:hypothetical protein
VSCSGPDRGRRDPTSSSFPLPASLTVAGRQAFEGVVQAYVTQLSEQLAQQSRLHRRRPDAVHTTQDVHEAKQAYEQRLRVQDDQLAHGRRVAIILLIVAAALGVLAITVTGTAQAALFGLFVAAEAAGLLLLRRSRPGHPDGG